MLDLDSDPPQPAHYSGRNKVPNIQEFLHKLDRQKKDRDAAIDDELKHVDADPDAKEKFEKQQKGKRTRKVRDPVTGRDVEIEDANLKFEDVVDNPMAGVPTA